MTFNSISKQDPHFVIPVGSQVVLKVDQTRAGPNPETKSHLKKAGSIGVVIQCPPRNDQPYRLRFQDSSELEVSFSDIVLRRAEIDQMLAKKELTVSDVQPWIIYRCRVGSRAFGLSHADSDDDQRGIFLPPADLHWSMYRLPNQVESMDRDNSGEPAVDEVYWELERFLNLALKANPNILEVLWSPMVMDTTPLGQRLIEIRSCLLSRHIYKTYSGYVLSQFRRMRNSLEKTGTFKRKHAMHLVRLLHSGISALQTGEILVDVSAHRDELLSIRNGEVEFELIRQRACELDEQFAQAFEETNLPQQPDFQRVDQFLIDARRSRVV